MSDRSVPSVLTYVCSLLEILLDKLHRIWTIYFLYGGDFNLGSNSAKFSQLFIQGVKVY